MGRKEIWVCILFCISFLIVLSNSQTPVLEPFFKLNLPQNTTGPESIAFFPKFPFLSDFTPYTSISDGRVLRFFNGTFTEFATTAPNRSKTVCDGKSNSSLETICGRPMGLALDKRTNILYIADAYFGLMIVSSDGGKAHPLVTAVNGVPFRLLNSVDIDPKTGFVYFIDSSAKYQRSEIYKAIAANDTTGRLLQYNPVVNRVTVLLEKLGVPVGLAVSKDGGFVIFSEYLYNTTKIFWTDGPMAGRSEVFAEHPARPENIRRNERGEFWVAVNNGGQCIGQKFDFLGRVVQTLIFDVGNTSSSISSISEIHEYGGELYVGSVTLPYVSVFNYQNIV